MRAKLPALLLSLACAAVPAFALPPDDPAGILDMHVHVAGIGAGGSGCYLAPALRDSYKFRFYLRAFETTLSEVQEQGDRVILDHLSERIRASQHLSRAVVLALDGVIDASGEVDYERTQVLVPNEYLAEQVPRYGNFAFGASINPYRRDALDRLEVAKQNGAVLVKWIPAIMHIDPSDPKLEPFYRKLIELRLPLLTHAGFEHAFAGAANEFGDPALLRLPLDLGVTVIVAHIATTGEYERERSFDRVLPMFERYQNLYTDISSLTQINKLGYLRRALELPAVRARMLYGSDWPLQFFPLVSPWYHVTDIGVRRAWRLSGVDNPWDRDVELKRAIGVPEEVFQRAATLLF